MNAIATLQQNYIDVEFPKLNDLTARLRIAGAKISVKKLGTLHRIILLQKPSIASVEQILDYANKTEGVEPTSSVIDSTGIISENDETTAILLLDKSAEFADLDELKKLPLEKIKKLATQHKIPNRSKMSALKLAENLQNLGNKSELL